MSDIWFLRNDLADDGVDILLCKCRAKKGEIRNDLISRSLRILLVPRAGIGILNQIKRNKTK